MNFFIRWILVMFLIVVTGTIPFMLFLGAVPVFAFQEEDDEGDTDEDEVEGGTYESDDYGFTISYEDDWQFLWEESTVDLQGEPVEAAIFDSTRADDATAIFQGRMGRIAAEDCVEGLARYWRRPLGQFWLDIDDLQPRESDDDQPIAGGDERDAFAVFDFESDNGDGTLFIRCQRFQADEALLLTTIIYNDPDDYDDTESVRERLLDGVHLP